MGRSWIRMEAMVEEDVKIKVEYIFIYVYYVNMQENWELDYPMYIGWVKIKNEVTLSS